MISGKALVGFMVLMFGCVSFGQGCLGDLVSKQVRCCNAGMVENSLCQGSIGNSCEDLLTLRQCTLTCSIAQAGACPEAPVKNKQSAALAMTDLATSNDLGSACSVAFSDWARRTMAKRRIN